jgi:hypothetical protein
MQWGPNGTTIAQDWQQRQIGKKSPSRHRSGRGEGCHSSHPSQGASKDRHLNSVRPVCGGSAKPRQKDGPERQSGARLAMMPIRREDTAKMGTRSLSPLRGRPLAKTRYFQGSRNRARKRTAICVRPPIPDPVPNAQVICKKSWRIGHRSADLISAAAHVPSRA